MKKEYNTEQKRAVLDFFCENRDRHFTVSEVSSAVEHMGAGKSTVYRQISKLFNEGTLRRFEVSDSRQFVYQFAGSHGDCDSHFHLKCVKCGRLIHMECSELKAVSKHIEKEHSFVLGFGRSVLYGECSSCAERSAE